MVAVTYKPCGLRVECVCDGPGPAGGCPMVLEGQAVPCAGRKVVLSKDELPPELHLGLARVTYWVPPGATECPMLAMEPDRPRLAAAAA